MAAKKIVHQVSLVILDAVAYFLAYLLANVFLGLLNLDATLKSVMEAGELFNLGLPATIIILSFLNRKLYTLKPYLFRDELQLIVKATLTAAVLIFFVFYFFRVSSIKISVSLSLLIFLLVNPILRNYYRIIMAHLGLLRTNVIIVGTGAQGQRFHATVKNRKFTTYNVVGYIANSDAASVTQGKILGLLEDIPEVLKRYNVDEAVIAIPKATRENFLEVMKLLEMRVKSISFIPDMYGVLTVSPEITDFDRVLTVRSSQGLLNVVNKVYKRIFDLIFSFFGVLVLIPLYAVVFVLVKLDDGGKVVFTQNRIGRNGEPIRIYKFRTMVKDAEKILQEMMAKDPVIRETYEREKKLENDPRITRVGKILRKTSLDEFPQFINVLQGNMSIVGPRPYLFNEIKDMEDKYDSIIKIKPGITGLWQATGRNDISFDDRVVLDQYYVRNWTVWFDFVILLKTIQSVLASKGVVG